MIAVMLLMFVGGIAMAMGVSDPRQVTLRWLRLGGIVALALLGVAVTAALLGRLDIPDETWAALGCIAGAIVVQLILTQLGKRSAQRAFALIVWGAAACSATWIALLLLDRQRAGNDMLGLLPPATMAGLLATAPLASGLLGGSLMAMLLGHAYLTAGGEMTQAPFRRLVLALGVLLVLRAGFSVTFGLWPYGHAEDIRAADRAWNMMLICARYLVGLVVPAIFTYMTYDCVQRRANQSATGILYVTIVLIIVGEGAAMALLGSTGLAF